MPGTRNRAREQSEPATPNADVFLSHASVDRRAAERVRRMLQTFRHPHSIWGRALTCHHFHHDGVPTGFLQQDILSIVEETPFLVYLASPEAAKRPWVDRECAAYLARHSSSGLMRLVVRGFVGADLEPPSLHALAGEPLWLDARVASGPWLTWLSAAPSVRRELRKVAAKVFGCEPRELRQRELQRAWLFGVPAAIVFVALVLITLGSSLWVRRMIVDCEVPLRGLAESLDAVEDPNSADLAAKALKRWTRDNQQVCRDTWLDYADVAQAGTWEQQFELGKLVFSPTLGRALVLPDDGPYRDVTPPRKNITRQGPVGIDWPVVEQYVNNGTADFDKLYRRVVAEEMLFGRLGAIYIYEDLFPVLGYPVTHEAYAKDTIWVDTDAAQLVSGLLHSTPHDPVRSVRFMDRHTGEHTTSRGVWNGPENDILRERLQRRGLTLVHRGGPTQAVTNAITADFGTFEDVELTVLVAQNPCEILQHGDVPSLWFIDGPDDGRLVGVEEVSWAHCANRGIGRQAEWAPFSPVSTGLNGLRPIPDCLARHEGLGEYWRPCIRALRTPGAD